MKATTLIRQLQELVDKADDPDIHIVNQFGHKLAIREVGHVYLTNDCYENRPDVAVKVETAAY